jgi:hypothetical protein
MTKEKVLNIRLSLADYDLIQSAAEEKLIAPSTLVRSLAITAIKNKFQPVTEPPLSPSPNLDKLSFDVRKQLLSWLDMGAKQLLEQNVSIPQIEQAFLTGLTSSKTDFLLANAPKAKTKENFKMALNS